MTATPSVTRTSTPGSPLPTWTTVPTRTRRPPTATITPTPTPVPAMLVVGSASGAPGDAVSVEVVLRQGSTVAGTLNEVAFPPQARIAARPDGMPDCTVDPSIGKDDASFRFQPPSCAGSECTAMRAIILSFVNVDVIPSGSVLYSCVVEIAADAESGDAPLSCSRAGASDAVGHDVPASCIDGAIHVGE